tara:strand:+ start:2643 stop:2828 length:186 start_codon:yes stop_codon:yes gene_type:complete
MEKNLPFIKRMDFPTSRCASINKETAQGVTTMQKRLKNGDLINVLGALNCFLELNNIITYL